MPELPEVETFRRRIEKSALHRQIERVHFRDADRLLKKPPKTIRSHLLDHELTEVARHGKYLFVGVGDEGWLVLHFGMTGDVHVCDAGESAEQFEFMKMQIDFADGGFLVYQCPRKFGRIDWADDRGQFAIEHQLGPDAMAIDWETFRERITGRRTAIKTALMDQATLAGIGNIYSDEVLFQARIHPLRKVQDLTESQLHGLYDTIRQTLPEITSHLPDSPELDKYLVANREEGATCPRCGSPLAKEEIAGRSSYFCPHCQDGPGG